MATRRKRPTSTGSNEGPFAVAVEQIHGQFRVFGEALEVIKEDLSRVKEAVLDNTRDIKELKGDVRVLKSDMIEVRRSVGRIEGSLALKVDRDEVVAIVEGAGPRT